MAWQYNQTTGVLSRNGAYVSKGYSGHGRGKNNPKLEGVKGVGPLPAGKWRIVAVYNSKNVGPYTLTLYADDGNNNDVHEKTGRGAFRIHGDSIKSPGNGSRGCIILPRAIREKIWTSGDKDLIVTN